MVIFDAERTPWPPSVSGGVLTGAWHMSPQLPVRRVGYADQWLVPIGQNRVIVWSDNYRSAP